MTQFSSWVLTAKKNTARAVPQMFKAYSTEDECQLIKNKQINKNKQIKKKGEKTALMGTIRNSAVRLIKKERVRKNNVFQIIYFLTAYNLILHKMRCSYTQNCKSSRGKETPPGDVTVFLIGYYIFLKDK